MDPSHKGQFRMRGHLASHGQVFHIRSCLSKPVCDLSSVEAIALLQNTKGLICVSPTGFTTSSKMNLFPPLAGLHSPRSPLDCIAHRQGCLHCSLDLSSKPLSRLVGSLLCHLGPGKNQHSYGWNVLPLDPKGLPSVW